MANKKTQRDFFNEIIVVLNGIGGNDELVKFCEDRIEALNRKSASRKPSKTQVENENIKSEILATVNTEVGMTVTEIQKANPALAEFSNQKISALIRIMEESDKTVKREKDGKKTVVFAV